MAAMEKHQASHGRSRAEAWAKDGYFFVRGMVDAGAARAIEEEVTAVIRADPASNHTNQTAYFAGADYFILPEPSSTNTLAPEDAIGKVFNCHVMGAARRLAEQTDIVEIVAEILGPNIDCFQSQFIFKHPGVIGQPWHQDSYYFRFDRQPQVGVWVALSPATLENGCLWVLPGSHRPGAIFNHVPDRRQDAMRGYLEIVDRDTTGESPALMETGDVLFFHSYLMHRSTDNVADFRRSAMVFHFGRAGTQPLTSEAAAVLGNVNRWAPVRRGEA
ncbi:MAG: phytanoyl-CoA dioxygenase family protein [Caulobacteraceae bacterium]